MNQLLRGAERSLPLRDMLELQRGAVLASSRANGDKATMLRNVARVEPDDLRRVHRRYSGHGLFQLLTLAQSQSPADFDHFWSAARDQLVFQDILDEEEIKALLPETRSLAWDNAQIQPHMDIDRFNHNVLNARLSRQLYHPGAKPGYLVHGLGGPRILISHPFRGVSSTGYDIYRNAVDVVTSLGNRGWYGSFLFLDRIDGLEAPINGLPAWAVWFSLIAAHSDAVLFVKQHLGDFGPSQRLEMALTPVRVNRKIVEVPAAELKWAASNESDLKVISIDPDGNVIGNQEFDRLVSDLTHARAFLPLYSEDGFPRDRLIHIDDHGAVSEYEQSHTGYSV